MDDALVTDSDRSFQMRANDHYMVQQCDDWDVVPWWLPVISGSYILGYIRKLTYIGPG